MTFFSGTDTNTLQEEGFYKNNFVSLIVNNAGTYTAAITRHVFSEIKNNTTYTYEMFGDGTVAGQEEGTEKKECIEYFMMEVHKPEIAQNALDGRIDEILENKRKSAAKVSTSTTWWNQKSSIKYNEDLAFYTGDEDDADKRHKPLDIPWKEPEFQVKPNSGVDEKALKTTMARLLTSSMTCNVSDINIDSWISNYDKVYASKFSNVVDFSEWLAPYLEYLMYHIPGNPTDIIDEAAIVPYANAIIAKIGKPKGQFSKELTDQLSCYGAN